ncbi:MAG: transglutaminase domain-containing protein, partial [Lachnospiraceae bacterium]|nr:transglutaminase domain-containing protein [Lachnospiraceae bacterium]
MKFGRVFKRLLMILIAAAMILPETGAVVWADDISSVQGSYVEAFPEAIDDIGEAGPVADEAVPEISGIGETDDVLTGDADSEDISFESEGISNDSASPTVYCNTKAEAYEAVRNIIRNRVNKMDYYNAKITNPDKVYNNFVYDRIYVREDLFGAMYISMTDVCDFEEERMGMKPYEGDYMYNLIGDSINPRFFYEDPQSPDDPDVQTWIESGGVFYKLYEVYLPVITTKEQEDELDKKVEEILSTPAFRNVKDGTNDQKIKVIFDYVKGTVKSASGDRTRPIVHTAYSALCTSGHQGTCEAYAQAFYRLAREMGVPARVLMGLDANNHTYNLVKRDDGYWWFIDCSSGTYLKSYKEFKHAQLQDRFKTPKFQYNYWNNVKDYTDRVDPTRVFRNGDEILTSIDLQELYEYTRNDMAAHPGAEYLIRLGSDQTVDETNGEVFYFYGDERKKVSLDLNGHTLNLRSSGDIYLKEIKNGSITIGKAEVFRGHVYGQSGQWRLNADLINDLSITGLLNGFDRCFICGNNDTKISNVSVNKLHFWARNKLILNGDLIINNCS